MTEDEFRGVCLLLEEAFKGEMPDARRSAYATFLMACDGREVMAALARLVEEGQMWTPTPGEIRRAMAGSSPPWELAWAHVARALRRIAEGEHAVIAELQQTAGDLVAGWVATYGARRLAMEPVFDPDRGGMVLHRLRQSYAESVDTAEARRQLTGRSELVRGLAAARQAQLGMGT